MAPSPGRPPASCARKRPVVHLRIRSEDDPKDQRGVQVRREFFEGTEERLEWPDKKGTQEFTFGYALTCHKAQGSQWDKVCLFDEGASFRDESMRWRYTAATRAAEELTVVI
jgi:exodeoxyribonuclease-5